MKQNVQKQQKSSPPDYRNQVVNIPDGDTDAAIGAVRFAVQMYQKELVGRKFLILYGSPDAPSGIETVFYKSNFLHLTGIKPSKYYKKCYNRNAFEPNDFYRKALKGHLQKANIAPPFSPTTLKLRVLGYALDIRRHAKKIGIHNGNSVVLQTEKLVGDEIACIGLERANQAKPTRSHYAPNTLLKKNTAELTSSLQDVLCILEKKFNAERQDSSGPGSRRIFHGCIPC